MFAHEAYLLLVEAYLLLDDGDHQVLGQFGLNPTQFAALKLLDIPDGLRSADLIAPLLIDKSSVSRLIDRLEQAELVQRGSDPDDRRAQRVVLTPAGRDLCERARVAHEWSLVQRLTALNEDEQRQLGTLLDKLRVHLRAAIGHSIPS